MVRASEHVPKVETIDAIKHGIWIRVVITDVEACEIISRAEDNIGKLGEEEGGANGKLQCVLESKLERGGCMVESVYIDFVRIPNHNRINGSIVPCGDAKIVSNNSRSYLRLGEVDITEIRTGHEKTVTEGQESAPSR